MKVNYHIKLQEIIKSLGNSKPLLLLHSCCGPCSTQVIDYLKDYFKITIYYFNPNIEPEAEYIKRKAEQVRFLNEYNKNNLAFQIDYLDCDYDNYLFKDVAQGLEAEKEGGVRCVKCFYLRLKNTALKAKNDNFSYFGTTLTVSPHKNSALINEMGAAIAQELNIKFIYGDFKKDNGYQNSIKFSKKYNLYRQKYCGCLYGKDGSNGNK